MTLKVMMMRVLITRTRVVIISVIARTVNSKS